MGLVHGAVGKLKPANARRVTWPGEPGDFVCECGRYVYLDNGSCECGRRFVLATCDNGHRFLAEIMGPYGWGGGS